MMALLHLPQYSYFIFLDFAEMFIPPEQEISACGFSSSLIAHSYLILLYLFFLFSHDKKKKAELLLNMKQ